MRRWPAAALALAISGAAAGVATAATFPSSELAAARFTGAYRTTGTITQAVGVPGERPGESISRTWVFSSPCATGACPLIALTRQRQNGTDRLFLRKLRPGVYFGHGAFTAGVQCAGRLYRRGLLVPYTITVNVTGVLTAPDGSVDVSSFSASYGNPYRIGLTPCYSPPSHDAARYEGVSARAAG